MSALSRRNFLLAGSALAVGGVMGIAGCAPSNQSSSSNTAGGSDSFVSAMGTGVGKKGNLEVEVVMDKGNIVRINTLKSKESVGIGDRCIEHVSNQIVDNQTLNIDVVTGATATFLGYTSAVSDALDQLGEKSSEWKKRSMPTPTRETPIPDSADIIVVGSGGAGLSAGMTAASEGKRVIILEKLGTFGGSTALAGGETACPGNWLQQKEGLEDSTDKLAKDMLASGDNMGDPALVNVIAQGSPETIQWLTYEAGASWSPSTLALGGHSVKRCIVPTIHGGCEFTSKLVERVNNFQAYGDIEIFNNVEVTSLVTGANNAVTGVEITDSLLGETKKISCQAVILATGGFGANVKMRTQYNPAMGDNIKATVSVGAMGQGLTMASAVGAELLHMEYIQTYPICDPETGSVEYTGDLRFEDRTILVNKEGKRFVEELQRRDVMSEAIKQQTDGVAYLLFNQDAEDTFGILKLHSGEYENELERGIIQYGETLADVAEPFGVDAVALQKTVDTWNQYCKDGSDPDFNYRSTLNPIDSGPYYLLKTAPGVHYTMGGLRINTNGQVLNKEGNPIPNLFAAGEVAGGIMGTNRLGATSMLDIFTFGRVAGKSAATTA